MQDLWECTGSAGVIIRIDLKNKFYKYNKYVFSGMIYVIRKNRPKSNIYLWG